jgi:hypothetical protein
VSDSLWTRHFLKAPLSALVFSATLKFETQIHSPTFCPEWLPKKISPAAISIPAELAVAAAAFNFAFTLLMVEAPTEYQGPGDALSTNRRAEVVTGQSQIPARRLGALFDSKLVRVPHFINAYGKRVSEICATMAKNAQNFPEGAIFGAQMFADGTNIWAGATSRSEP